MSPTDETMPGIKGKRLPGKPGRFAPSQPLHMTTRRAAKTGTTNGSPSLNGSVDDNESRRGSFDDSRPFTSHSNGSQVSAKSRTFSDEAVPFTNISNTMNGLQEYYGPHVQVGDESIYDPLPPLDDSPPSPSRKRKRSSSPVQPSQTPTREVNISISVDNDDVLPDYNEEGDTAELVHPDDLSDREVPPSQLSSQSDEAAANDAVMVEQSVDATPLVSGRISPATSESNSQDEQMTTAKQLTSALEAARAEQEEQEENDDLADAADAADDLDDGEEVDEQVRSDDDGRPRRGRFGGRRRAKHANPRIEAAMARQSELKSAYRIIARAQKAVLAEIAKRTIDDLEADHEMHTRVAESNYVRDGLAAALEERKARLEYQRSYGRKQLNTTMDSHREVDRTTRRNEFEIMKDERLDRLEHEILQVTRDAQLKDAPVEENETEDEDDIVPRPKGMGYKFNRTATLDREYDSRSRPGLEAQTAYNGLQRRIKIREMLAAMSEEDGPEDPEPFTVRDNAAREIALERRKALEMTKRLADASAEVERLEAVKRAVKILPNDEAYGLKLLSDLASRPSIGSIPPATSTHKREGSQSYVGQTHPQPMPPHLQLQTQYGPSRIPVEMSPRTSQAMNDRFDPARPPPRTPLQESNPITHSPEIRRSESRVRESPKKNGRLELSSLLSSRPESRKGSSMDQSRRESFSNRDKPSELGPSPFRASESRDQYPSWREYPQEQQRSVFERREPAQEEKPWFEGLGRQIINKTTDQLPSNTESSQSFGYVHSRPFQRPEFASQAGAAEARDRDFLPPRNDAARRATIDSAAPQAQDSVFSIHDGDRQKIKGFKNSFNQQKTTKADRGGATRKEWGMAMKSEKKFPGKPLSRPGPASAMSPSVTSPTFGSGHADRGLPSMGWQSSAPPMRSPLGPEPPSVFGRPPFGPPPPPAFHQGMRESYQHRDSFPPQGPGSIWNQPSPSPLYAVPPPQPNHAPPPSGPHGDQYNRFGPPPPVGFGGPPQNPQSAPGSYGQQFGGPPLAPATSNQGFVHPPGFRPTQGLPAFAQQAQQQGSNGNSGHRRRAQSDASFHKFQSWQPPSGGRR